MVSQPPPTVSLRDAIQQASREQIQRTWRDLTPIIRSGEWLNRNRYEGDVIRILDAEREQGPDAGELTQYIAASAPLHCSDGWSFLAQSVSALLSGDWASALHLAYYAELRASMSFLATEGIGVFDWQHYLVDAVGTLRRIRGGRTHSIAWEALEEWAQHQPNTHTLLSILRVDGTSLVDWLAGAQVNTATQTVLAESWLQSWGLDLKLLSQEHNLRNTVSYRPTRFRAVPAADGRQSCEAISQFWKACEPGVPGSFSMLDRHLLRVALEKGILSTDSGLAYKSTRFVQRINQAVDSVIYSSVSQADNLKRFLTRQVEPEDHLLLKTAGQSGAVNGARGVLPVVARATLLLRIASASCAAVFQATEVGKEDLEFWWRPYGLDAGLWDEGDEPDEFAEL